MTTFATPPGVGGLLRDWRQRRRLSQLDLASNAQVSTRHLSFVETGRSTPSRDLVLHLAEHLEVPVRDRNALLLAAGYAPAYRHTPLDAAEMTPVRDAIDKIVKGHEPFPAVVVDRRWDLVSANASALSLFTEGASAELLDGTINALRLTLHPDGVASRIVNFTEWAEHLLDRLDRQIAVSQDQGLIDLVVELRTYPGVEPTPGTSDPAGRLFVPLILRQGDGELSFLSTVATFGTALDVTIAELAIESFFPANAATAMALHQPARSPLHEGGG